MLPLKETNRTAMAAAVVVDGATTAVSERVRSDAGSRVHIDRHAL
jgi:hypothetical protein